MPPSAAEISIPTATTAVALAMVATVGMAVTVSTTAGMADMGSCLSWAALD